MTNFPNKDEFDLDLFIKCAKELGATVRKTEDGHGGVYVNGKPITAEELFRSMEEAE